MENLSVAIIIKDEKKTLAKCLQSVCDISDDVVVVIDSKTTDNSAEIAKKYKCNVVQRNFDNFANQKNYALDLCTRDWVLSVDADEEITSQLATEIKLAITNLQYAGYKIPRLNYFFGKPVLHTNWSPREDTHVWLFKKSVSKWVGRVHEEVDVNGNIGLLANPKIHFAYSSVDQFITKMNQYTSYEAEKTNFSYAKLVYLPLGESTKRYLVHLGFLDGWIGLYLSYLMAIYRLIVVIKTWQREHV